MNSNRKAVFDAAGLVSGMAVLLQRPLANAPSPRLATSTVGRFGRLMLLEMGEVLRVPCPCHERIRPPLLRLVSMPRDRLARVAGYVAIKDGD